MAPRNPKMLIDRLATHLTGASLMPVVAKLRDGPCAVTLNAGRVERIDIGGLEALLVLAKTQIERGHPFELDAPSHAFSEELAFYGVAPEQLKGPQT